MALIITVAADLCCGHHRCVEAAPELYRTDEDGFCACDAMAVPEGLEQQAEFGAQMCPEGAITLAES